MIKFTRIKKSERPRKESREGGVSVSTYLSRTTKKMRIRFKFIGKDVDWLPYLVSPAMTEDEQRIYFLPDPEGYTLSPEHKSASSMVFHIAASPEYNAFIGDYKELKFDESEHLFYIDKSDKATSGKEVTLSKEEYDKIMEIVKMFAQ